MLPVSLAVAVGLGGCAGALLRFYISAIVARAAGEQHVFLGTLTVNLIGCFLMGGLAVVVVRTSHLSPHAQRALITGLLGSLTTFSAFALDSVNLLQQGRVVTAVLNVTGNVVIGVLLLWCGMRIAGGVFAPDPAPEQNMTESDLSR